MSADDPRMGWTSASNALADSLCPGRHIAQRGLVEPPKGDDAHRGTRIHKALAEGGNSPAMAALTREEREMRDSCHEIEVKITEQFFGKTPATTDPEKRFRVFRHKRYWAGFKAPDGSLLQHSGEADAVKRAGVRALILDYKTLAGDVPDSPANLQLRDLVVMVKGNYVTVDEIATVIIQPLVTHSPEICVYGAEDIKTAEQLLGQRVVASNDPASPRVAGEVQCAFCLAKSQCVEYQKWAGLLTPPAMLSVLEVPMLNWSPEQRALAANALGPALDFLEELKAWLKAGIAADPEFVPGWTLAPTGKTSTITNPELVFERFQKLGGTPAQFMPTVNIVKGRLADAVEAVTKVNGVKLKKALEALTEGCVEVKEKSPSLKKVEV
jgi:hypothetical protein